LLLDHPGRFRERRPHVGDKLRDVEAFIVAKCGDAPGEVLQPSPLVLVRQYVAVVREVRGRGRRVGEGG